LYCVLINTEEHININGILEEDILKKGMEKINRDKEIKMIKEEKKKEKEKKFKNNKKRKRKRNK
jgi:hypothetical protein